MNPALWAAKTGLDAQQTRMTVTSNNLANVKLITGSLESSNVNTADAMVNMIELARRFDLQVKAMRTAEENAATAAQLLRGGV